MVDTEVWRAEQNLGLLTSPSEELKLHDQVDESSGNELSDYEGVVLSMREQMLALQDELQERDRQISELRLQGESILANASVMRQEAERDQLPQSSGACPLCPAEMRPPRLHGSAAFCVVAVPDGLHARAEEVPEAEKEMELQMLHADREVLERQLQTTLDENERLHRFRAGEAEALKRLQSMEVQVQLVVQELAAKEQQLAVERKTLARFQELEEQV